MHGTGADWVQVATALAPGTTTWTDNSVAAGDVWEYKIRRMHGSSFSTGYVGANRPSPAPHWNWLVTKAIGVLTAMAWMHDRIQTSLVTMFTKAPRSLVNTTGLRQHQLVFLISQILTSMQGNGI